MDKAKVFSTLLVAHFKLNAKQSPMTNKEKNDMEIVLCTSAVGSLIHAMVCTRLNLAYVLSVVNRFVKSK